MNTLNIFKEQLENDECAHLSIGFTKTDKGVVFSILDREEWRPVPNRTTYDTLEEMIDAFHAFNSNNEDEEEDLL